MSACDGGHCVTCADEAIAMTVLRVDATRSLALCVDDGGTKCTVEIALIDPVAPDDTLLVHAGTAIAAVAKEAGT